MGYATAGLSVSQMAGGTYWWLSGKLFLANSFYTIAFASLILLILIHIFLPKLEIGKANRISFTEAYKIS